MASNDVLALVFLVAPGFIADAVFRVCWGWDKGTDFDRTVRSLSWSVFGLGLYILVAREAPSYIAAGIGSADAITIGPLVLLELLGHTAAASALAYVAGRVASKKAVARWFTERFGRTIGTERPWEILWARLAPERLARVETKAGKVYWGRLVAASTGDEVRELVLSDPSAADGADSTVIPMPTVRYLYLRGDDVSEVRLAPTDDELQPAPEAPDDGRG